MTCATTSDELWGLGIGCNGLFRVLLQPLSPDDGLRSHSPPWPTACSAMHPVCTATVVESRIRRVPPGATVMTGADVPVSLADARQPGASV